MSFFHDDPPETKYCTIDREAEVANESGRTVPGVTATCDDCGAVTEAYGRGDASVKRCLAAMREQCSCIDGERAFFEESK